MYKSLFLTIGVFLSLLISDQVFSQSTTEGWITTEATITEVKDEGVRRRSMWADVSYKSEDGKSHNSSIKLFTIPFIGTFKKAGDKVNIVYNPAEPAMIKSQSNNFMDSYGVYILIVVGVLFSLTRLKSIFGSGKSTA